MFQRSYMGEFCSWTDMAVMVKRLYFTVKLFQSLERLRKQV